jgi:hypothetical protein
LSAPSLPEGGVQNTIAWPGCPALVTADGLAYALVGDKALGLIASEGHELRVRGRVAPGTCTLQNAIEVVEIELVH